MLCINQKNMNSVCVEELLVQGQEIRTVQSTVFWASVETDTQYNGSCSDDNWVDVSDGCDYGSDGFGDGSDCGTGGGWL